MKKPSIAVEAQTLSLISFKTIEEGKVFFNCASPISLNKLSTHTDVNGDSGVYALWWIGKKSKLITSIKKNPFVIKPIKNNIVVEYSHEWESKFGTSNNNLICLYVGKSSTSFKTRINRHKSEKIFDAFSNIFPEESHHLKDFIMENIGFSFFSVVGKQNAATRYYLENVVISELFPILNISIEH